MQILGEAKHLSFPSGVPKLSSGVLFLFTAGFIIHHNLISPNKNGQGGSKWVTSPQSLLPL